MLITTRSFVSLALGFSMVGGLCSWSDRLLAAEFKHPTEGYSVAYPDDWYVDTALLEKGGPLSLMSFSKSQMKHGGIFPPGGAGIIIQVRSPDIEEGAVLDQLHTADGPVRSRQSFRGAPAERLDFTYEKAPDISNRRVAVSRRVGGKLFLVTLTYRLDGANALKWEEILADAVGSLAEEPAGGK